MEMARLRHVGKEDYFYRYWPHMDTTRWPGREFKFAYCHPVHTIALLTAFIGEVVMVIVRNV